jgi:predicted CXXCH cytochrome family protein
MRRPLLIMLGPAALTALCWVGCSVERDYKILSIFFEGVPTPEELRAQSAGSGLGVAPNYVIHPPFAQDKCLECHVSSVQVRLTRDDSGMCLKCHEGVPTEYTYVHGPVRDSCLWCHDPHLSGHKHLLRLRSPGLCRQCHDEGLMSTQVPGHQDPDADCLECHQGHGGPTRGFLRPSYRKEEADGGAVASGPEYGS